MLHMMYPEPTMRFSPLTPTLSIDDGDLDICFKPWGVHPWNDNNGRMHVDFLKNLLKGPRTPK